MPAVLFAHRISPNAGTGYSPFYLTYGRDPLAPAERIYDLDSRRPMFASSEEYVDRLSGALRDAYAAAREFQKT